MTISLTSKNEEGVEHFLASVARRLAMELGVSPDIDASYQIVCEEYYKHKEESR